MQAVKKRLKTARSRKYRITVKKALRWRKVRKAKSSKAFENIKLKVCSVLELSRREHQLEYEEY